MRSYTYHLRSLLRPLVFALFLAFLTSSPALLGMEGCGMMIGSRNGMVVSGGGGAWTNPYVTDGLIGLWDGEWNVAGGQHDGSATTWVDISGNNRDAVLSGTYSWGSNYWHVESIIGSSDVKGLATWPAQNLGSDQTIELVIDPAVSSSYGRIIAEAQGVASPVISSYGSTTVYMYGYGIDAGTNVSGYNNLDKHLHQIVHPSGGPMYYYIDGVLVWTATNATSNSTGATSGYFANRSDYGRGIDADYFTMRRYNRVLTDNELAANMAVDAERFGLTVSA